MYSQTVLEAKKMAWWYLLGLTVSKLQERILVAISQPLEAQASWLPNSNLSLCLYMVSPSSPCFSPLLSFVLVQGVCIPGCSRTHDLPTSAEILVLHHGNPLSLSDHLYPAIPLSVASLPVHRHTPALAFLNLQLLPVGYPGSGCVGLQ